MPVELALGDPHGLGDVLVRQGRIDDGVAVPNEVGRFDAAWDRVPAVEEQDSHSSILALVGMDADAADAVVPE